MITCEEGGYFEELSCAELAEMERRLALLTATTIKLRQWMCAADSGTPSEESAAFMELASADGAVDWLEPPAYLLLPEQEVNK